MTAVGDMLSRQVGIPAQIGRPTCEQVRDELAELWRTTTGREPENVLADLDDLRFIYDPVLTGRKLRDQFANLGEHPASTSILPAQCRLRIDDVHAVITPEGRVALELVNHALDSNLGPSINLDEELTAHLLSALLTRYREWGRHRIDGVVRLLNGGKALQIQAIGGALTLLVNRSDIRERAVRRVAEGRARDDVDAAFRVPAQAFSQIVAPSDNRSAEKERLISGWTLHEINRRRPGSLIIDEDVVYVDAGQRDGLLAFLAGELARPRRKLTADVLASAFDALVAAYRRSADTLAGFGMSYERPYDTESLRDQLLAEFVARAS